MRLPDEDRYAIKARTGVDMPMHGRPHHRRWTPIRWPQVPLDGETQGEIMIRGNTVMKGYLKNPKATAEAFAGGYFHSGDIAFQHADGYLKIADRAKDIIISGGENISSVEVEGVLMKHPAVLLCAVVARPDDKWGEMPCAFVETQGWPRGNRGRADRLRSRKAGRVQMPQNGGVPGTAQNLDRQDPEV